MDKKLVAQNELCKIYTSDICESLTRYCECWFNDFPSLINYKVYICETNTGEISFVLFDSKGQPITASCTFDGIATEIEKLRFLQSIK